MNFFVKDFCETMQAGVVIFCLEDDNDILHCEIATSLFMLILPSISPILFLSII